MKALGGLEKASSGHGLKEALGVIQEKIRQGSSTSEALEKSGRFPAYFHQTLYAGEISGQIPMVLRELAKYTEKEQALKRSMREALIYPCFILLSGFATLAVLLCFVLPKLRSVYDDFGADLPWVTRIILGLSDFFLPLSVLTGIGLCFLARLYARKKDILLKFFYGVPVIGEVLKGFYRVQFSRLLWLLLESGVPVLEALSVMEKTVTDTRLKIDIKDLKNRLAAGARFSESLQIASWMDPVSLMLVASGEESGRLPEALRQIARDTESGMESFMQAAMKILEPVLILLIGVSVGFVVIATVLPIFDISALVG